MKTIIIAVILVAFAYAEPPLSNSYLPPPPSNRPGFSQGPANQNFSPQIVAARTLDGSKDHQHAGQGPHGHGSKANAFGRSGQEHGSGTHGTAAHGRLAGEESSGYDHNAAGYDHNAAGYDRNAAGYDHNAAGYDRNAAAIARNALEEINSEPANYNFGYMVNDYQEGTDFGHHEERQEEHAQGEYHVVLPDGRKQTVSYEADERGFKPQISYEDSEDLARSGYDSNANNIRSGSQGSGYSSNGNHDNGYSSHGSHDNAYSSHGGHDSGFSGHENGYASNLGNSNARSNGY